MRLVIVGYGKIARKHHEVFKALNCEVSASCNRTEESNKEALLNGIPRVYTDVHKMIEEEKPDGIINCVSFWSINSVTKSLLKYKIPILIEKPSGTTIHEHKELIDYAEKFKTPVQVAFNRRHYSVLQSALDLIGDRSSITSVSVEWSENPHHLINNRNFNKDQVEKIIFGNSIHGLDLLTYLSGEPISVNIDVKSIGDNFKWIMQVSGKSVHGTLYNFHSNWTSPVPWRIVFSAPEIRFVMAPLETCLFYNKQDIETINPNKVDLEFKAGFYKQAELFLELIRTRKNNFCSLDSATPAMELAEALTQQLLNLNK